MEMSFRVFWSRSPHLPTIQTHPVPFPTRSHLSPFATFQTVNPSLFSPPWWFTPFRSRGKKNLIYSVKSKIIEWFIWNECNTREWPWFKRLKERHMGRMEFPPMNRRGVDFSPRLGKNGSLPPWKRRKFFFTWLNGEIIKRTFPLRLVFG